MKLQNELAKRARELNICDEWYYDLKKLTDKGKMVAMYVRGIDFCLKNNYPDNEYIREHFKGIMEGYGVHLDEKINIDNEKFIVSLGSCTGSITTCGHTITELFVKNNSTLNVSAEGSSFIVVDIFDNADISVTAFDKAKVLVNRYGGSVHITEFNKGSVKLIEKNKPTY